MSPSGQVRSTSVDRQSYTVEYITQPFSCSDLFVHWFVEDAQLLISLTTRKELKEMNNWLTSYSFLSNNIMSVALYEGSQRLRRIWPMEVANSLVLEWRKLAYCTIS